LEDLALAGRKDDRIWAGFKWLRIKVGSCEYCNKTSRPLRSGGVLHYLREYKFPIKDSVPRN